MLVTIAICTWNRADSLAKTLETVNTARGLMHSAAEIIVVNNNSTDHTDAIIDRFATKMPLHRVFEPMPGLSNARNAAIEAATGDYLVWTDDDVLVDPYWLASYEFAFESHPDASFFGGPIIPRFDGERPTWIAKAWTDVQTAYATRDFGDEPFLFPADQLPFGANFAVRMTEQKAVRYDPRFGRKPSDYWLVGEESQVLLTLLAEGKAGWWVPGARVQHCIPPDRQTTAYLRQYFTGCGRTMMIEEPLENSARFIGRPLRLWRHWLKRELRYRWRRVMKGPEAWVPALVETSEAWGMLQGSDCRQRSADNRSASR